MYSFFPFCINEWNMLDNMIKRSVNIKCLKSMLMKFFSLQERSLFSIHDPTGVKLLTNFKVKSSCIVYEVIRAISNQLIFFFFQEKILSVKKAPKWKTNHFPPLRSFWARKKCCLCCLAFAFW